MSALNKVEKRELGMVKRIQEKVKGKIEFSGMSTEEIAQKLGMLPSGVEALLSATPWSIETAVSVATALGIEFKLLSPTPWSIGMSIALGIEFKMV